MGFWVFGLVLGIGIGPRDEEDATVANNDANANANDGPKTSDMTQNNAHSAAQRDPIRSPHPRSKVSSLWRTNKILYSYFMPKMLESPRVDQINAIVCPFLVKLCALHKQIQIQQIQTTTHPKKRAKRANNGNNQALSAVLRLFFSYL